MNGTYYGIRIEYEFAGIVREWHKEWATEKRRDWILNKMKSPNSAITTTRYYIYTCTKGPETQV